MIDNTRIEADKRPSQRAGESTEALWLAEQKVSDVLW
jgi:hypothetical protein